MWKLEKQQIKEYINKKNNSFNLISWGTIKL